MTFWFFAAIAGAAFVVAVTAWLKIDERNRAISQAIALISRGLEDQSRLLRKQSDAVAECQKRIERLEGSHDRILHPIDRLAQQTEKKAEDYTVREKGDVMVGRDAMTGAATYAPKGAVFVGRDPESNGRVYRDPASGRIHYRS